MRKYAPAFFVLAIATLAIVAPALSEEQNPLCGNGLIDRPAEECDFNAFEYYGVENNGCPEGQVCSGKCRCLRLRRVMRYRRGVPPEAIRRLAPAPESEMPSRAAPPAQAPSTRTPNQPRRAN